MDVYTGIYAPDCRTEALDGTELVPFRRLCVVNLESDIFADLVCSTANHHHDWAEEDCRVLVAWCRCLTRLVRRFDPVPATVTVTSQAPRVTQTCLVSGSPTEAHHHSSRTARLAECGGVIYTW